MYEQYDKAVQTVLNYLVQQGYTKTPQKYFRQACREHRKYLEQKQLEYSRINALIWIEALKLTAERWKFFSFRRAMALIDDVLQNNTVTKLHFNYNKNTLKHHVPEEYIFLLNEYLQERKIEGKQPSTVRMDMVACSRFLIFLKSYGIINVKFITPELIKVYHNQANHKTIEGKNAYIYRIRNFVRFLARKGFVGETLELAFPTEKANKLSIVTTLTKEQVERIKNYCRLSSTPSELRSAAVSILALRMGFRSSDICNLCISDISWQDRSISIVQQKTAVPLKLPFPVEVGNILIKYIINGRPTCNIPNVFTTLTHPYKKMEKTRCYYISLKILGEKEFPEDIRGLHIFRKTFASNLLLANNPISLISTVLGHTYEGAVDAYLATNEQQMRLCSIGLTGVEIQEEPI